MKAKYLYIAMMSLAVSFGFSACSSDDDGDIAPVEQHELAFDTDTVTVGVGETATFNITDGNGDYKIISEDPTVASATVADNVVTVTSQKKGITGLVVSDGGGYYKRILVKSMYFKMALNKSEVKVGMKLGHTDGIAKVVVTEGNGNYKATSADESIAKINRIDGDSAIVIQGVKKGTTTVTITDMMGLSQTVNVTVETTTIPYSDDEIAELKASDKQTFIWDGNERGSWYDMIANHNGNTWQIGYGYGYGGSISTGTWTEFDGELTEGAKYTGKIVKKSWYGDENIDGVEVEIIKVDGSKVWGIMSLIKDDYLHYGNFMVDTENPETGGW